MTKTGYVDGFVLVVPKVNMARYKKLAADSRKLTLKLGALDYKECVLADDMHKWVTLTFPKLIKPKAGEQVWFSFISYKSKAHRDQVNKKVMDYYNKKYTPTEQKKGMPFDMKRMAMGGFKVVVG